MDARKYTKKAQMQLGENVIILFIFFILLIFAVVFFTRLQKTTTQNKISEDIEGRGLEISRRIQFLPEFQCSKGNVEIREGCYDEYSILGLEQLEAENNAFYYDIFGNSRVSIQKIFPGKENPHVIYERAIGNASNIITTNTPITLCNFVDPNYPKGKCSFGVLKVEVFT